MQTLQFEIAKVYDVGCKDIVIQNKEFVARTLFYLQQIYSETRKISNTNVYYIRNGIEYCNKLEKRQFKEYFIRSLIISEKIFK